MDSNRRKFLITGGSALLSSGLVLPLSALEQQKGAETKKAAPPKAGAKAEEEKEEEVSTNEDLMREHGVLNRVLLIYDEAVRRIRAKQDFDPAVIGSAAQLIKSFIEDYHEKLEENYLFPRFEKAGKMIELTVNLRAQHAMGRRITDRLLTFAKSKDKDRAPMAESLEQFIRMYRPHEAREDTVLFPAFHQIVSPHEYDALGEEFEQIERKTFGGDGFEMAVAKVTDLEKQLGIYDLAQFTPNVPM
ncbi:MAG TPA: hemerythrin domain-containing protein [Candidatus Angelobacter sp.]